MTTVSITAARNDLADIFDSVVRNHERIVIERYKKDRVAIVPVEDLERLQALENAEDIADADAAMAESGKSVSYDEIRAELGL